MTGTRTFSATLLTLLPVLAVLAAAPTLQAQVTPGPLVSSTSSTTNDDGLDMRFANGIAAIVEDRVITVDDIRRELAPILPQIRRDSRNAKEFQDKIEAVQEDIVRSLIDRTLVVKDFYKDGKRHIPASYIDNAISEQMAQKFDNDRAKFLSYLRARGLTLRDYRKEVEEDLVYGYMRGQQRKSQSIVSPARVETFYKQNQNKFYQEEAIHLRMIQLNRAQGEKDSYLIVRANEIIDKFNAGEKFENLAKTYTQDARKARGGDWGWQRKVDLKSDFSTPLFSLKKGGVTAPILQGDACFILYAEDYRPAGVPAIDEVRDQIERTLAAQMARESQEKWLETLRRKAYIKLY